MSTASSRSLLKMIQPDTHSPPMRFQLLHFRKLHYGAADISKTLLRQVRAGDVLHVGR
jgi:hypothetical protein